MASCPGAFRKAFCVKAVAALLALFWLVLAAMQPAVAVQPDEILKDSALETRARALSRELRCMVCQNQSIDDSDADLARDLRILVRERLTAGDSDEQVIDFLVARYGEFVLLQPRFAWHNAVLWLTPLAVLIAGAAAVLLGLRRRRSAPAAAAPLSADEERRLAEVIDQVP
ncbi:MAG: cytochrome c-type biogenesis protein CcmH [Bradyrhizobiaceae bacterium]|nr:cytochrome c-type biogenesis protein CcmH [Bradyrhizobiaceae bacterium]